MRQAFAIVQDKFSVFEAQVTELGLAKVNPHDDVLRFELCMNRRNLRKTNCKNAIE